MKYYPEGQDIVVVGAVPAALFVKEDATDFVVKVPWLCFYWRNHGGDDNIVYAEFAIVGKTHVGELVDIVKSRVEPRDIHDADEKRRIDFQGEFLSEKKVFFVENRKADGEGVG
eukprot:7041229-Ditylum_brightwellii.AAC.1